MRGFFRRLFAPAEPPQPRLSSRVTALENLVEDLDSRIEYLTSEIKKVRGRQFSLEKKPHDDTGETIDEQASQEAVHVPHRPPVSSAHLSRRFRGF